MIKITRGGYGEALFTGPYFVKIEFKTYLWCYFFYKTIEIMGRRGG
jgi:hypothetical protein